METIKTEAAMHAMLNAARTARGRDGGPYFDGVVDALAWLAGEAQKSPICGSVSTVPPSVEAIKAEDEYARWSPEQAGLLPVRDYCFGVHATLEWALGMTDRPPHLGP